MRKPIVLLPFALFTLFAAPGQRQVNDSLLKTLAQTQSDSGRLRIFNMLGNIYSPEKPDSAVIFYENQLTLSKKIKNVKEEIKALLALGKLYRTMGDNLRAGKAWQRSMELCEDINDSADLASTLNSYGYVYYLEKDFTKELSLYKRAELISGNIKDNTILFRSLSNMGSAYLSLGELDSAQAVYQIAISLPGVIDISYALSRLAEIKYSKKENDSALYYSNFSNAIILNKNLVADYYYMINNYILISTLFSEKKQVDSAMFYANKSYEIAAKAFDSAHLIKPAELLSGLYKEQGNYEKAFYYLQISKENIQKSQALDKQKEIFKLSFEEQQREKDIAAVKEKLYEQIKFYSVLVILGIFLILALILFRNNRQKQRNNVQLTRQKEKIEFTLGELKSTQSQLIQSEKMASLGELTAGIAHEIQNPLNFVNNFSEVSVELIKEMVDEVDKGNTGEVKDIAKDLVQNLEKINHHGKRADAIVKGMLQHSRTSSATKEPTDINKLADEYLRLAYHGIRAKDNSFNATLKTDFDETIGNINAIPQDIGRVILNLITNAFYVVDEKKKSGISDYEPTVSVSTKKINNKIEIKVADNGNGIPAKILDKIFQPFFTTKPTGQGTGLGLSLSYDIVKAHGGELKVETKENKGSTFIIFLNIT